LIISQWFDPEPTFKGLAFARELRRQGYEVSVLTGFPNYPGGSIYPGFKLRPWQRQRVEGIDVLRVWLWPSHSRSAVGRVANYLSFGMAATFAALVMRRPSVAYLYHPPGTAALPALCLKWFRGVPFVLDIQDMWPDTLTATGMVNNQRLLSAVAGLMSRIYRAAARIVVLSPGFKHLLLTRGVPRSKITVIPNWTYEEEIPTSDSPAPIGGRGEFSILYSGNVGPAQALDIIIAAAERTIESHPQIVFVIMGGGIDRARLEKAAAARQLPNIRFLPRCTPIEAAAKAATADALLIHLRDEPLFAATIPSKTQAALRAGKPILIGVRGDAADLVGAAQAGIAFQPGDGAALAAAAIKLADLPADVRLAMGASGAQFYDDELSMEVGAKRFAELFSAVVE
jgi:glycosyltransferase involved in cell wall biosynthesis